MNMKKVLVSCILAIGFTSCTKEKECPIPEPNVTITKIVEKIIEVQPKKDTLIGNTRWYSLDSELTKSFKKDTYMMFIIRSLDIDLFWAFDKVTAINNDVLTANYKYNYPKLVLLDKETGKEATGTLFKGILVNDTTMTFYNKVFYKVK